MEPWELRKEFFANYYSEVAKKGGDTGLLVQEFESDEESFNSEVDSWDHDSWETIVDGKKNA